MALQCPFFAVRTEQDVRSRLLSVRKGAKLCIHPYKVACKMNCSPVSKWQAGQEVSTYSGHIYGGRILPRICSDAGVMATAL